MSGLLRRLRGAVGIGITWGVLWVGVGFALSAVISAIHPGDIGPGEGLGVALPILGLVGFLSGLGFAAFLTIAERKTRLSELSLARVALWGLLGSAAIPLLMGTDGSMGFLTGPMGSLFATVSLALARRSADPSPRRWRSSRASARSG